MARVAARSVGLSSMRRLAGPGMAAGIAAWVLLNTSAGPSVRAQTSAADGDVAQMLAEVPQVQEVSLSPDARAVVYAASTGSVERNDYVTDLLLQTLDVQRRPVGEPRRLEHRVSETNREQFRPQWCPDALCVTYFSKSPIDGVDRTVTASGPAPLVRHAMATGQVSAIPLRDSADSASRDARPAIRVVGSDYKWSPSGRLIAFTAKVDHGRRLDPRRGTLASTETWGAGAARSGVFVLDPSTGQLDQVSPSSFDVSSFGWAPDDQAIAFGATPDAEGIPSFRTELFVLDLRTRQVRQIVKQPGLDDQPTWSPDGKWIAFMSQLGVQTYHAGWPAVVPAAGGQVVPLADDDLALWRWLPTNIAWKPGSDGFYYASPHRMALRLVDADVTARRVALARVAEAQNLTYDDNFSISHDGRWVAFTRESPTTSQDVFIASIPDGRTEQLTHLRAAPSVSNTVRVDRVEWPSRDGKFTIPGLLLTPRRAWRGEGDRARIAAPLPTVVYANGGPSMVGTKFVTDGHKGALLPLAMQGYAVLAPNTRGRGGYGKAFERGMADGPSAGRLPYEDLMAGVDYLVQRGIADPARLGLSGHSYGGYLVSYVITKTSRFQAAVVHEAHVLEWVSRGAMAGEDWKLLFRDLYGIRNPYDPVERERLVEESPGFNLDRVKTPTLLIFGAKSGARDIGWPLFNGLQRRAIPSELAIYDEGHAFVKPAAVADDITRTLAWFDYWLRDRPYPDTARGKEYDAWRTQYQPRPSVQ